MKKGLMGLDALILFMAIVLVLGVLATVLISTGNVLTQKSLIQASEERKQVSSGLEIIDILGTDASREGGLHTIDDIFIKIRLVPGSMQASFNSTIVYFFDGNRQYEIFYNTSCDNPCTASTTTHYNVYYIHKDRNHMDGHIHLGDIAVVSVHLPEKIIEDREYSVGIIPLYGPRSLVKFQTPSSMVKRQVRLWPVS
jgi:flagellin-like protein